jgi:hypothetical protein
MQSALPIKRKRVEGENTAISKCSSEEVEKEIEFALANVGMGNGGISGFINGCDSSLSFLDEQGKSSLYSKMRFVLWVLWVFFYYYKV